MLVNDVHTLPSCVSLSKFYSENPQNTNLGIVQTKADPGPCHQAKTKQKVHFPTSGEWTKTLCVILTPICGTGGGGGGGGETALLSIVNTSISSVKSAWF